MTVITCSSRNTVVSAKKEQALIGQDFYAKKFSFILTNQGELQKDYFSVYLGEKPLSLLILESTNFICIVTYVKSNLVWKSDTAVFYFLKQNKKPYKLQRNKPTLILSTPNIFKKNVSINTALISKLVFVRKTTQLTESTRRCNFCICFYPLIFQIPSKYLSNET